MPTYDYECSKCQNQYEAYVPNIGQIAPCPADGCGSVAAEKIWGITRRNGVTCFPYVTRNITPDGSPIEVKSESHLQELCKQYNVTHRPDAAWTTKEWHGYDPFKKKQVYTESSGVGLPGCWI